MKFSYTIIYVDNVEATVNFYAKTFKQNVLFKHESNEYAEMDTGGTKLAFASSDLAKSNGVEFIENKPGNVAPGFEITFTCSNVQDCYQHALENGAINVKTPVKKPWGQEVAYVRDLNGVIVAICSAMEG
jgi:lactoylglutathione lyase